MKAVSTTRVGAGVAALLLLIGVAACSKTEEKSDQPAGTTTSSQPEGTTTTKKSSALDKLAKGEASDATREQAQELESNFANSGLDLDDAEVECLAEYLAGSPDLADIGDSPTAAEAAEMMDLIASCIPKEKFVTIVIDQMDDGSLTAAQLDCIETQLLTLSSDDMAALMSGDTDATAEFSALFAECENP